MNTDSLPTLTLNKITKKSTLHFLQNKYKKQRKPKRWWLLTSKIQAFRSSHKKYKPTIFNIQQLLPELLPNILDFTVGSKKFHQNNFNKCIDQLNHITIQKTTHRRTPRYAFLDTLDSYYIDHIDIWYFMRFYIEPIHLNSKQLYPNHLFKNIHIRILINIRKLIFYY